MNRQTLYYSVQSNDEIKKNLNGEINIFCLLCTMFGKLLCRKYVSVGVGILQK